MSLPPELRLIVYEELLARRTIRVASGKNYCRVMTTNRKGAKRGPFLRKNDTSILRANKFINNEALEVLYKQNKFDFSGFPALERFLRDVKGNPSMLRNVVLAANCHRDFWRAIRKLCIIENLKSLKIGLYENCGRTASIAFVVHFRSLSSARMGQQVKHGRQTRYRSSWWRTGICGKQYHGLRSGRLQKPFRI